MLEAASAALGQGMHQLPQLAPYEGVLTGDEHTTALARHQACAVDEERDGWSLLRYLRVCVCECGGFPGYRGLPAFEPLRLRLVEGLEAF